MPGRVLYDDLSRSVKSLVVGRTGPDRKEEPPGHDQATGPTSGKGAGRWLPTRCHVCGQTFCHYGTAAEAHIDATRHLRMEVTLCTSSDSPARGGS